MYYLYKVLILLKKDLLLKLIAFDVLHSWTNQTAEKRLRKRKNSKRKRRNAKKKKRKKKFFESV
jgi:hypothetical protein